MRGWRCSLLLCLALGTGDLHAASLEHDGKGKLVRLSGALRPGDSCRLQHLLERHASQALIEIDSPGGDAWEGIRLAHLFARRELRVRVAPHGKALSAAAVAVLGSPDADIQGAWGFHGFYIALKPGHAHPAIGDHVSHGLAREAARAIMRSAGWTDYLIGRAFSHGRDQFLSVSPGLRRDPARAFPLTTLMTSPCPDLRLAEMTSAGQGG